MSEMGKTEKQGEIRKRDRRLELKEKDEDNVEIEGWFQRQC